MHGGVIDVLSYWISYRAHDIIPVADYNNHTSYSSRIGRASDQRVDRQVREIQLISQKTHSIDRLLKMFGEIHVDLFDYCTILL